MIEHDDELKDLFRKKNLENEFPLDEQNWKTMSSFLKNEEKKKKRLLVYFSLLLLMFGLGGAWLFVQHTENTTEALTLTSERSATEKGVEKVRVMQHEHGKQASAPLQQKRKALKQQTVSKETSTIKNPEASPMKVQQPAPVHVQLSTKQAEQAIKNDLVKIERPKVEKKLESQTEKQTTLPAIQSSIPEKELLPERSKDQESALKSENKESATPFTSATKAADDKASEESPLVKEQVLTQINSSDKDPQDETSPLNLSPKEKTLPVAELITLPATDSLMPDVLALKTSTLPLEERDLVITAVVPTGDTTLPKAPPSHRIFFEAGINYMLGWKTTNKTEASGFNPLIGLQYYHDVTKRMGLSIGVQYTTIDHLSSTSHTSTTTRLKFGEEVDATIISALNMHYLLMPLKLNYSLSRNDFVCIGYTIAYLLNVQSRIETYSTRQDYSSVPVVSKAMGYTTGFNPYDGQITVCYRRRLYKELYVNGELFYGLRDIKNNVIYASDVFERACGFRLSIGINLWKK